MAALWRLPAATLLSNSEHRGWLQCYYGPSMREVELNLKGWKLADALGELRKWLDHNNCIPANFDIAREDSDTLRVRIEFREDDLAERFERDFGG